MAVSATVLALLIAAAVAFAVTGELTQLPGTAGCVSIDGTGGACANGKSLGDADSVAVSADGKSAYVAAGSAFGGSRAVGVFTRDTTTGALTQLPGTSGCVSEEGSGGICADGKLLSDPESVAVSPDGKNVYVVSQFFGGGVAVFARDTGTGALTQLPGLAGCISDDGSGGQCSDGKALLTPTSVAVSADGKNVYVASRESDAVAVLQRDTTTGELTQFPDRRGCVSETGVSPLCRNSKGLDGPSSVAVSPDDKSVYVASTFGDAVAVFRRDTTTGGLFQAPAGCVSESGSGGDCADGRGLDGPFSVAVSPDGKRVYVASLASSAVAVFRRDATTSALTQLGGTAGCVSETGSGGQCRDGKALLRAKSVAVSGDGQSIYVASDGLIDEDDPFERGAVAVFKHSKFSGLSQLAGTAGCVSETGSAGRCADGKALIGQSSVKSSVTVSADGKNVYVASPGSDAVAVFARETAP